MCCREAELSPEIKTTVYLGCVWMYGLKQVVSVCLSSLWVLLDMHDRATQSSFVHIPYWMTSETTGLFYIQAISFRLQVQEPLSGFYLLAICNKFDEATEGRTVILKPQS